MRSKSLRRAAAGLSLAVCLSLIHVPAAHAKAVAAHGRGRHVQSQPASHGLVTTLWNFLARLVTGSTAQPGDPATSGNGPSSTTQVILSNTDVGASADPNGFF